MKLISRLAAACLMAGTFTLTATAQQMTVETGTTKPLRLSRAAANVVIGNQNIADVAVAEEVGVTGFFIEEAGGEGRERQ